MEVFLRIAEKLLTICHKKALLHDKSGSGGELKQGFSIGSNRLFQENFLWV